MKQDQNKGLTLLLLFISPIIGLFCSIKYLSWQHRKLIIILFFIIYGSLLRYGEESDAGAYMRILDDYINMSFSDFFSRLKYILMLDPLPGSPSDVYVHFLAFFTVGIVGTKLIFFPIVAGIYGYFYVMAMSKILVWKKYKLLTTGTLFIIVLFMIHRSVTGFQTVRTWTGLWILFNGVLGYHQTKNRKYLLLMFCAPLVHFVYFIIALPAFLGIYYKKVPFTVIIAIYFVSFLGNFNGGEITGVVKENSFAKKKVYSYYRENSDGEFIDPIALRREESGAVWYAKYGKTDAVYYGGNAFAFFIILMGFYRELKPLELALFATGLIIASLANFGSISYAFYSRTMANAVIYILATVSLMAIRGAFDKGATKKYFTINLLKWICIIIFIPKIIYFIANLLLHTSIFILGFPFIGWLYERLNISIRELIGVFL